MQTKLFLLALLSGASIVAGQDTTSSSASSSASTSGSSSAAPTSSSATSALSSSNSSSGSSTTGSSSSATGSSSSNSGPAPSATSKAIGDLASYHSSLFGGSAFSSFSSELATIITDTAIFPGPNPTDQINPATLTAAPDFTKAPSDVQSFFSSVYQAEQSIISKDLSGAAPQPTGMIMAAGAAAAGVLGVAAML